MGQPGFAPRSLRKLVALAAVVVAALPSCSSSSPTPPTPVVTTPAVTAARIAVTLSSVTGRSSTIAGFAYQVSFGLRLAESAGLGANLNFIRMEIYTAGGTLLERLEIGANSFTGGNRLLANQTRDFNVTMGFNSDPIAGRFLLIGVGTTDDRGNNTTFTSERFVFP